jgi:hypothetical protein
MIDQVNHAEARVTRKQQAGRLVREVIRQRDILRGAEARDEIAQLLMRQERDGQRERRPGWKNGMDRQGQALVGRVQRQVSAD